MVTAERAAAGPTIRRGQSEQVVETPDDFIQAVERKFGPLIWDLAALPTNTKAPYFITPEQDSFSVNWHCLRSDGSTGVLGSKRMADVDDHPLCWLNCEFADIAPWARKCVKENMDGAEILLLVPGSIGANWYWSYVQPFADVYSVGRMVFKNCYNKKGELITTPYPKDLILCHYSTRDERQRMQRWRWK